MLKRVLIFLIFFTKKPTHHLTAQISKAAMRHMEWQEWGKGRGSLTRVSASLQPKRSTKTKDYRKYAGGGGGVDTWGLRGKVCTIKSYQRVNEVNGDSISYRASTVTVESSIEYSICTHAHIMSVPHTQFFAHHLRNSISFYKHTFSLQSHLDIAIFYNRNRICNRDMFRCRQLILNSNNQLHILFMIPACRPKYHELFMTASWVEVAYHLHRQL